MKAENIEKHMLRRTVVAAHGGLIGVIKQYDAEQGTAFVEGFRRGNSRNHGGGVRVGNIRKATAAERAEFYERVDADERGVNDGFARLGGMPRGFEAWRGAQDAPATEPTSAACSVGWMFTTPEPAASPFAVGQRVRITDRAPLLEKRYVGKIGIVTQVSGPQPSASAGQPVHVEFADLPPCWFHAYCLEAACEPEPVVAPQHKVGDLRVWLRSNGIGAVARVMAYKDGVVTFSEYKAYNAADVFDPTPENMARLVEQQRERGIVPELGDLVFVLINRSVNATALVAHNVSTAPDAKLLQGAMCGGGAFSWGLAPDLAAHTLVIRRCPFRGVKDE